MRLAELEPRFVRREIREGGREVLVTVETPAEADGLWFVCPGCYKAKGGRRGCHSILCYKPEIPMEAGQGPGRWPMSGTGFDDLTLTPSIQLLGATCQWHGFITNGEAITV